MVIYCFFPSSKLILQAKPGKKENAQYVEKKRKKELKKERI